MVTCIICLLCCSFQGNMLAAAEVGAPIAQHSRAVDETVTSITQAVPFPVQGKALAAAEVKDQIAQDIGAANTMVRQPDGGYKALNTDWVGVKVALEQAYGASCVAKCSA